MKYTPDQIKRWDAYRDTLEGGWKPARPYQIYSFKQRLKLAWLVLIGRYDAIDWEQSDAP